MNMHFLQIVEPLPERIKMSSRKVFAKVVARTRRSFTIRWATPARMSRSTKRCQRKVTRQKRPPTTQMRRHTSGSCKMRARDAKSTGTDEGLMRSNRSKIAVNHKVRLSTYCTSPADARTAQETCALTEPGRERFAQGLSWRPRNATAERFS
jgi:hypothetical protein